MLYGDLLFSVTRVYSLAVVLAPFFVHLEVLFALGYRPQLHNELKKSIDEEIARVKKAEKVAGKNN